MDIRSSNCLLAMVAAAVLSVHGVAPAQPPPPAAVVTAWLDCVECSNAELKSVVALGESAIPELRRVLLNGPAAEQLAAERQHLQRTYRTLKDYEQRRPERRVPLTESEYVRTYEEKFVLLKRGRAARALGAIATDAAVAALREVLKTDLPADLRSDVERALKGVP